MIIIVSPCIFLMIFQAEQIFVSLCVHLIRKVPRHGLTLQRLEEGLADASEAQKLLQQALRINELRRKRWETWYQTLVPGLPGPFASAFLW